jgi:uncharacterized protein involved in exopolysaccharide biosynthesis
MGRFRPRNISDIIKILRRRLAMISFIALVVLAAAFVIVINMPKLFESRALVLVSGAIYDKQANGAQIAAVTEQLTSRATLESLINRHDLNPSQMKMDAATGDLEKAIKLDTKYRSDSQGFPESFTLSYRHRDPKVAQQVVTDLVSVFSQANATLERQAVEEMKTIRAEMADIDARLAGLTNRRATTAARSSAASRAASAINEIRTERRVINSSVEELQNKQFMLEQQIANQKRLILQQQEIARSAPPPVDDSRAGSSYGALVRKKAQLEAQIQDLASNFTDKYPKLVQAREQLEEVNRQLAAAAATGEPTRAAATSPAHAELRSLQRELSRLETDLEVVNRELSRKQSAASTLPAVAPRGGSSSIVTGGSGGMDEFEERALSERYSALLRREEALKQFQPSTAGPAAPFFQLVDEPNLPEMAAAPNRSRLMMLAAVLALAVGLLAVAIVEIPKFNQINDDRDVSYYLGVPVIALIPETLTAAETGDARRRTMARRLVYLIVGAAAVPALIFAMNALGIFQILGSK